MRKAINLLVILVMLIVFIISLAMISTAEGKAINYKSTISEFPKFSNIVYNNLIYYNNRQREKYYCKNLYFVLDNYDTYKYLGFSDKNKGFFKDNLLIVNYILGGSVRGSIGIKYKNTGVTINNGTINVSYTYTREPREPAMVEYAVDVIELKRSDVKGVDLTKEEVVRRDVQMTSRPGDVQSPDTYTTEKMVYVDANKLIKKPEQVEKVKVKPVKNQQLKLTWKKIKGVKYEVKYSLNKNMKNAKTKKNIKTNKLTLKKLKSGNKYYVKVRAYYKIGNKTYLGKWSKKAAKIVK